MPKRRRHLRVLHCPVVALYQTSLLTRGLREAGVEADSMVFDFGDDSWLSLDVDHNLGLDRCSCGKKLLRITAFLLKAARRYDVFHFHSGRTLLPLWVDSRWSPVPVSVRPCLKFLRIVDFLDLPFLRMLGKKTVFSFWGCDIRKPTILTRHEEYMCHHCLPGEKQCESPFRSHLYRALKRYGDAVFLSGDLVKSYPRYHWLPNAIDLDLWNPARVMENIPPQYRIRRNGEVLVLHAFANRDRRGDHKGTRRIEATVQSMIREGLPIRYMTLDGVPIEDVRYLQVQADIVVDQFRLGCYGSFALESMALARPVVGWIEPELFRDQGEIPPILSTDLKGLESTLADLAGNPEKRRSVGEASRQYAERVHDYRLVGRRLKEFYDGLLPH
ncbi:MAG: hypothetical protein JXL84_18315 [Deltaproteobacteria bacterium]|nr:hypothetical protein [Deltaproteobacteria bacterium]